MFGLLMNESGREHTFVAMKREKGRRSSGNSVATCANCMTTTNGSEKSETQYFGRTNLTLAQLRKSVAGSEIREAFAYVITTVRVDGLELKQKGSGPNWAGGVITLCTCKAQMRSRRDVSEWPGSWIAGFTGCRRTPRGNTLVYLMRVDKAFESYCELWNWLPDSVREAKAAHLDRRGDLFEPISDLDTNPAARFDSGNYKPPIRNHPHAREDPGNEGMPRWYRDVDYITRHGKRAPYLVGDCQHSYVWTRAKIYFDGTKLPRDYRRFDSIGDLIEKLTQ